MAWIEVHQTLPDHKKLGRLSRRLGIGRAQAVGHLVFFWLWALDNAKDGDLSDLEPVEIAEAAGWTGEQDRFVEALRESGWIDADGRIHDWEDYGGKYTATLAKSRERMRNVRRTKKEQDAAKTGTQPEQGAHVPGTFAERSELEKRRVEDSREENRRGEEKSPHALEAPMAQAAVQGSGTDAAPVPTEPNGLPARKASPARKPRDIDECLAVAAMLGMPEQDAREWFRDCEVTGWTRGDGTPFDNWRWQMSAHRDRLRQKRERSANVPVTPPNTPSPTDPDGIPVFGPLPNPLFPGTGKTMLQACDEAIQAVHRDPKSWSETLNKAEADLIAFLEKNPREGSVEQIERLRNSPGSYTKSHTPKARAILKAYQDRKAQITRAIV